MQKRRLCCIGSVFLLCICMLTACTVGNHKKQKEEERADYFIGVVKDNAPYYYEDENGNPKGYYVNLMSLLSEKYSFTYEFVPVDLLSYEDNLKNEMIDAFIGVAATEVGKESSFFVSKQLYISNLCVLAPFGSKISNLKGIKDKSIVAVSGAEEEHFARYLANKYKGQAVPFLSVKDALLDIEEGNSQIIVVDANYYDNHRALFEKWTCLKKSESFRNLHKVVTTKNKKFQKIISEGLIELEKSDKIKKAFTQNEQ